MKSSSIEDADACPFGESSQYVLVLRWFLLLLLLKTCDLKLVIVGWWMFYDWAVKTIHESLRSSSSNMNLNHNSHQKIMHYE